MNSPHSLTTVIFAAITATSSASLISDLGTQFNAVILGDLNVDSANTEGRQLVVKDFNTNIGYNYTIGASVVGPQNAPTAGRDDLIVGGNYVRNGSGGLLVTEDVVIGGSVPADHRITFYNSGVQSSGTGTLTTGAGSLAISRSTGNVGTGADSINISLLQAGLISESQSLAQQSNSSNISSTLTGTYQLDITANTAIDDVYLINVSAAEWTASSFLARNITASENSTVIINVDGANLDIGGTLNLQGGITQGNVLINYHEAEVLTTNNLEHNGSILATSTETVNINGGNVKGVAFLGGEVNKTGAEFHNFLFEGDIPANMLVTAAVPEPSSSALFAIASVGFMLRRNKRR